MGNKKKREREREREKGGSGKDWLYVMKKWVFMCSLIFPMLNTSISCLPSDRNHSRPLCVHVHVNMIVI